MRAEQSIERPFVRLSLINVVSNVTVPLSGLVDTAMLGHLIEIRFLAGVALGSVLFDYVYWSFGFLRMGTTGTTAQAVGRGDRHEVRLVLYRSVTLALALGGLVLLLQAPFRELGFAMLSGTPEVEAAGREYFNARVWGAPATLCNFAWIGWFLGRAESRRALIVTATANIGNVLLDYLFILRLGLAAQGAGLATALSQYAALAVAVGLFLSGRTRVRWTWSEVFDQAQLSGLIRLNRDILLRTVCLVTSFAVFTNISSVFGTTMLAANAILMRLLVMAAFLIDGVAYACESLAGILLGRGDTRTLRRLTRLALWTGVGCAGLVLLPTILRPRWLFGLLTSHADVIAVAVAHAGWLVPTLLLGAMAFVYDGIYLGLTEGRRLRDSMLILSLIHI